MKLAGKLLRKYRKEKDISLTDVCEKVFIDKTYLSKIENGQRRPDLYILQQICKYLAIPVGEQLTIMNLYDFYSGTNVA